MASTAQSAELMAHPLLITTALMTSAVALLAAGLSILTASSVLIATRHGTEGNEPILFVLLLATAGAMFASAPFVSI